MGDLTVLVVGNGGREHALALALARDPGVGALHVAPGNPGTAAIATNHPVDAGDGAAVAELARSLGAGLVVVGPEAPAEVMELVELSRQPGFAAYFAEKGAAVSKRFADMNVPPPAHGTYVAPSLWRRAVDRLRRALGGDARAA